MSANILHSELSHSVLPVSFDITQCFFPVFKATLSSFVYFFTVVKNIIVGITVDSFACTVL